MPRQLTKDLYIQIGDIKTRYWQEGNEGSPIVLIHGLGGYIENWELNLAPLSKHHQVFAIDLVGCGLTEKPSVPYSIPYLAKFVQDFMALKTIEKPSLIGHSIGAGIAIELYLMNPTNVDKLTLVGGLGFGRKLALDFRLLSIPFFGERLIGPSREGLLQFFQLLLYDHALITDEMVDAAYERSSLPGAPEAYLATLRSSANFLGLKRNLVQKTKENSSRITVTTAIIWGKEDKVIPVEQAPIAEKMLPNSSIHVFDKCGHMPQIECAEEFNRVVLEFLADK